MALVAQSGVIARRVTILGATGSVGSSTLDLIGRNRADFDVVALTAQSNVEGLAMAAREFKAKLAVIGDQSLYGALADRLAGSGIRCAAGAAAVEAAAAEPADCVVAAIVGIAGLIPTLAAVAQGRRVALANKECLVSAGDLFMAEVDHHSTELVPVDSEHAGVFQLLAGQSREGLRAITLTASGGPFRTLSPEAIAKVGITQALAHPNWSMGRKISIDSATLMNKGLELIEAQHLFAVRPDQLQVVVHPQSIVHALVEFADGAVLAQLASHDMRTPIALGLAWPMRMETPVERLDLVRLGTLTFEAADMVRFPALALARAAMLRGGLAPTVLNGANEAAVAAFLDGKIGFVAIAEVVADTLELADKHGEMAGGTDLASVLACDAMARVRASDIMAQVRAG